MSSTSKGNGLISRAVHEALSTLVAPPICEQLIRRSLRAHGLNEVPERGPEVAEWLEESLKIALEEAVGIDAADLLIAQLAPMAAYAALPVPQARVAGSRSTTPTPSRGNAVVPGPPHALDAARQTPRGGTEWPETRARKITSSGFSSGFESKSVADLDPTKPFRVFEQAVEAGVFDSVERITLTSEPDNANELRCMTMRTLPPPSANSERPQTPFRMADGRRESEFVSLPLVLAATLHQEHLSALELYLEGTAAVSMVGDLASLLDALSQPSRSERLLLLDCMHPSVHVSSVSAISQDLPAGMTVVVWGIDEASWSALERDKSDRSRWVRCSHEASTDDVGSLCSMLLG